MGGLMALQGGGAAPQDGWAAVLVGVVARVYLGQSELLDKFKLKKGASIPTFSLSKAAMLDVTSHCLWRSHRSWTRPSCLMYSQQQT